MVKTAIWVKGKAGGNRLKIEGWRIPTRSCGFNASWTRKYWNGED